MLTSIAAMNVVIHLYLLSVAALLASGADDNGSLSFENDFELASSHEHHSSKVSAWACESLGTSQHHLSSSRSPTFAHHNDNHHGEAG